mmetsp:Transcript_32963/g.57873  ORF Transcript_32963/g.57873 Transcript_32963/m.57873 type:complete len:178 (-) Transcript_32963:69-602(-)
MNELFIDRTNLPPPRPVLSSKQRKAFQAKERSVERMVHATPRKSRVSASPALMLQQTRPVAHCNSDLDQRLSQMMSPADHSLKRQREDDFTTHSAKKFRGATRTAEVVSVELNRWDMYKTESFRCFFEQEFAPPGVSMTMIESLYDDDCPTDDENIEAAKEMLRRKLEEAVVSHVSN